MVCVVHVIRETVWGNYGLCGTRNKGDSVGKFIVCVVHVIRGQCGEFYGLCGTRNKGDSVGKFMVCVVHVIRGTVWGNLWFVWYT